jgi:hypothetical protein
VSYQIIELAYGGQSGECNELLSHLRIRLERNEMELEC